MSRRGRRSINSRIRRAANSVRSGNRNVNDMLMVENLASVLGGANSAFGVSSQRRGRNRRRRAKRKAKMDALKVAAGVKPVARAVTSSVPSQTQTMAVKAPVAPAQTVKQSTSLISDIMGLGGDIASSISSGLQWLGIGDYTVRSNSLVNAAGALGIDNSQTLMKFVSQGRGTRCIFRERIMQFSGANSVVTTSNMHINPGLSSCFPYLSSIAVNFEQWEPHGIIFEYKTLSSQYAAASALGQIVLACDYNPNNNNYGNIYTALESDYANDGTPAEDIIHGIECDPDERLTKLLSIRTGAVPSGTDLRFSDLGNFEIFNNSAAASGVVGELWVSYDISLYKKTLVGAQIGTNINTCFMTATTGISNSAMFGTNNTQYGNLFLVLVNGASSTFTFPADIATGSYVCTFNWTNSGAVAITQPTVAFTTNCKEQVSALSVLGQTDSFAPGAGQTATSAMISFVVTITGASAKVTLSGATLGTLTYMSGLITQCAYDNDVLYSTITAEGI